MMKYWRDIAVGDYFTLPIQERADGKVVVYMITEIDGGLLRYRSARDYSQHSCTLGWLIDNGLEII